VEFKQWIEFLLNSEVLKNTAHEHKLLEEKYVVSHIDSNFFFNFENRGEGLRRIIRDKGLFFFFLLLFLLLFLIKEHC
jgi:hypothetical protein